MQNMLKIENLEKYNKLDNKITNLTIIKTISTRYFNII